ncbi:hypothetical protein [Thiovibrio frasassiensis]|uniref:Uncharacterized protein n=1 Tax=Thiovibrio frasassiensis TaxID=2984131 RepID=A0A9X4ME59_9BACT|nr:hypothetical protein [Thiovibrio frasassiensis]MDG4474626.1 hypothetical protein [Thiovibrio frasassiensis]
MDTQLSQLACTWYSSITASTTWETTKNLANSTFITSLIGALAGAFAGAVAAQRTAERGKHREELLREIRNTNAAIAIAFGIVTSLLALKKQHVKDLKSRFEVQKAELLEYKRKRQTGEIQRDTPFALQADLQTLQALPLPTDTLRVVVFEKLSLVGRPLNLVITLIQVIHSLNESLTKRNSLIEGYKSAFPKDNQDFPPLYFGLPYGDGHVNLDYPATIDAIYSQTDDGIFFSKLLCKDLHEHGKQLSEGFKKRFKKDAPRVTEVDFSAAIASKLMPNESNYTDWVAAFVKKD